MLPDGFDPGYYLMVYGDVAESQMDPSEHYLQFGRHEGRTGVPPKLKHPLERELTDRIEFFERAFNALLANGIEGDYLEFGTGHGKTLWCAWKASRAVGLNPHLWAFDSFKGLPPCDNPIDESHPAWQTGRYAVSELKLRANLEAMGVPDDDLTTVPGFFADSLCRPGLPETVSLAYVDCDMYSSTIDVLKYLATILRHGSIVAFDDFFCWSPSNRSGEQVALEEFVQKHPKLRFNRYLPIGWHGMSFFVTDA